MEETLFLLFPLNPNPKSALFGGCVCFEERVVQYPPPRRSPRLFLPPFLLRVLLGFSGFEHRSGYGCRGCYSCRSYPCSILSSRYLFWFGVLREICYCLAAFFFFFWVLPDLSEFCMWGFGIFDVWDLVGFEWFWHLFVCVDVFLIRLRELMRLVSRFLPILLFCYFLKVFLMIYGLYLVHMFGIFSM